MQRTYFKPQHPLQIPSKFRSSSLNNKSPSQILELIKLKRSSINNYGKNHKYDIDIEPSSIKLCLPKICTVNTSIDFEKSDRHSRVSRRTIHTEQVSNMRQSTQSIEKQYRTVHKTEIDEVNSEDEDQQILEQARCTTVLADIMRQFPRIRQEKNLENLLPLVEFLMAYNPFFKNLPTTVVFAFLKICKIREFNKNRWIYRRNDSLASFYIIMWGKVKIVNVEKKYKKISVKGETLSEHLLFSEYNDINKREEGSKALSHCFLLEVEYRIYLKLYKELVLKGYKAEFLTMETLIRRNYILKQGLKERSEKLM